MNKSDYIFQNGTTADIDELEKLYDVINDYLDAGENYAGWTKGIYPSRATAEAAIYENSLFVLKTNCVIIGTVIMNHKCEDAYNEAVWGIDASADEVIFVHTLVIHPDYMKRGLAELIMEYAKSYAIGQNAKAIRLDCTVHNTPAMALYEKCGYKFIGIVDLRLEYKHLKWFNLYEYILAG